MEDAASKTKGLAWVSLGCFLAVIFVFGLSPLAHTVPWSWEKKLAHIFNSSANEEYVENPQAKALLQRVVQRIYPLALNDQDFSIDVQIIKNKEINAHAELGGKILINSALINQAESPEELAGILAHEIEHIRHRHILEGVISYFFTAEGIKMIFSGGSSSISALTKYFFNMNFSRSQESVADKGALLRLQIARVDNQGFKHFFERMEKSNSSLVFISDHPSNQTRLKMTERFKNQNVKPIMTTSEWKILKKYCAGN